MRETRAFVFWILAGLSWASIFVFAAWSLINAGFAIIDSSQYSFWTVYALLVSVALAVIFSFLTKNEDQKAMDEMIKQEILDDMIREGRLNDPYYRKFIEKLKEEIEKK